MQENILHRTF